MKRTFQEWNLKVPIIVTDNGSNMVKAFKLDQSNHMEEIIKSVVNESNKESEEVSLYSDVDQNRGIFFIMNYDSKELLLLFYTQIQTLNLILTIVQKLIPILTSSQVKKPIIRLTSKMRR